MRVVARRGPTTIVRTRHGLTLAAGGIDDSNVARGSVGAAARGPRRARPAGSAPTSPTRTGRNVGVVVTDTAGRAWREGQTDIAVGAAGHPRRSRSTPAGSTPTATSWRSPRRRSPTSSPAWPSWPQGKLGGRPFAVVRGRADLVLPAGDDGPGAAALIRAEGARPVRLRRPRGGAARGPRRARRRRAVRRSRAPRRAAPGARRGGAAGSDDPRGTWPPYGSSPSPTAGAPTSPSGDGDIGLRPLTP